uniref:Uncharacterized protein n=1 Tax=Pseudomonas phage Baskent_P1_112 TaxID=3145032 RepID=A0AAU8B927_9CAUD
MPAGWTPRYVSRVSNPTSPCHILECILSGLPLGVEL